MEPIKRTKRPDKLTQSCPLPSAITIHLKDDDFVTFSNVDERGYIRPNKRDWIGLDVTVLHGRHFTREQSIYVPCGLKRWLCKVSSNSYLSSVTSEYAGEDVTLIVHGGKH
jgi:hypothetical protein